MAWRVADCLQVLRGELNKAYPARDTTSDGTIGDAAHASRDSDHNPFIIDENGIGVVRAYDIDEDLDGNTSDTGRDAGHLADHLHALVVAGDLRIRYIIYDGKIASSKQGWAWRPYTGPNAHKKHVHLSVSTEQVHYDSIEPWGIFPVEGEDPLAAITEERFAALEADVDKIIRYLEGKELKTKGDMLTRIRNGVADIDAEVKRPAPPGK